MSREWLQTERVSERVPAAPSATVLPLRERRGLEVLLVRRRASLAFHGGAWVFPGGRVAPADQAGDALASARHAAVREAREEAGFELDPGALVPFAHWTTPEGRPKRFATWFFATAAPDAPVRVDGGEIVDARWWPVGEALAARDRGEIALPPPTFVSLAQLRAARLEEALAPREVEPILPRPVAVDGGVCSLYPGDAGYAEARLEAPGPRHRAWLVDPRWRYERG